MSSSLEKQQEDFVINLLEGLEVDLVTQVDAPYRKAVNHIIKQIKQAFNKYKGISDGNLRSQKIMQELNKKRIPHQINAHYLTLGKAFSDFMKGSLLETFNKSKVQAQDNLKSLGKPSVASDNRYKPSYNIEADVMVKAVRYGTKVNDLIQQGIKRGFGADKIALKLVQEQGFQIYDAKRLARTEVGRSMASGSIDTYRKNGIEYVKWMNSTEQIWISSRSKGKGQVCQYCLSYAEGGHSHDGVYPIGHLPSEIPAHPNCRCTLIPVL